MGDDLKPVPEIEPIQADPDDEEFCQYCEEFIEFCSCDDDEPDDNKMDFGDGDNTRHGFTKSYVDSLNF